MCVAFGQAVDPASFGRVMSAVARAAAIARKTPVRRVAAVTPATALIIAVAVSSNIDGICHANTGSSSTAAIAKMGIAVTHLEDSAAR